MSLIDIYKNAEMAKLTKLSVTVEFDDLIKWHEYMEEQKRIEVEKARSGKAEDDLFTPEYVCKKLKTSRSSLTRWNSTGYLVPIKVGGKLRYEKSAIDAILNKKTASK